MVVETQKYPYSVNVSDVGYDHRGFRSRPNLELQKHMALSLVY